MAQQLVDGLDQAGWTAAFALTMYAVVIIATRLSGLRSLAQLSAFDLIMTISIGSVLASTALSRSTPLLDGVVAVAVLFLAQSAISVLRRRRSAQRAVDNRPLVLMVGSTTLDENLRAARMTPDDIRVKLREHGIRDLDQVGVVVLERTGVLSVIERDESGAPTMDPGLLVGVGGADRVPAPQRVRCGGA